MTDLAPTTAPALAVPVPSTWAEAWKLAQRIANVVSGLSYTVEEVTSIDAGTTWEATTTPQTDPTAAHAPAPAYPDPADLFERVKATVGTEIAERLKALAAQAGRKLTTRDFADHPAWAQVIDQALEQLPARLADVDGFSAAEGVAERDTTAADAVADDDDLIDAELLVDGLVAGTDYLTDPESPESDA